MKKYILLLLLLFLFLPVTGYTGGQISPSLRGFVNYKKETDCNSDYTAILTYTDKCFMRAEVNKTIYEVPVGTSVIKGRIDFYLNFTAVNASFRNALKNYVKSYTSDSDIISFKIDVWDSHNGIGSTGKHIPDTIDATYEK